MQGSEWARNSGPVWLRTQLDRLAQMARKDRRLAGNSKLVTAAAVTSLAKFIQMRRRRSRLLTR
jgi:hypothetical protein